MNNIEKLKLLYKDRYFNNIDILYVHIKSNLVLDYITKTISKEEYELLYKYVEDNINSWEEKRNKLKNIL